MQKQRNSAALQNVTAIAKPPCVVRFGIPPVRRRFIANAQYTADAATNLSAFSTQWRDDGMPRKAFPKARRERDSRILARIPNSGS